jgi:hypothetical protein
MKVGDEYRIQTEESAAWNDEFLSQRNSLANEAHRVDAERDDRIRKKFGEMVRKLSLTQGTSKVTRDIFPVFDAQLAGRRRRESLRLGARRLEHRRELGACRCKRQAGNQSPTVFVFIPKRSADDLRHYLIDFKAASATLDKRGVPNTAEGTEARSAMETTKQTAEGKIRELLQEAFSGARVFQGGGNEILGTDLQDMTLEAATNALQRLYPQFHIADHAGWPKVYEKAQKGAPDALKSVGDDGEPAKNPVCKAILAFIAGGKKGIDIRKNFEGATYGWPGDAVDGGLQVLLVAGLIRAQDEKGKPSTRRTWSARSSARPCSRSSRPPSPPRSASRSARCCRRSASPPSKAKSWPTCRSSWSARKNWPTAPGATPHDRHAQTTKGWKKSASPQATSSCWPSTTSATNSATAIDTWTDLAERIDKRLPAWNTLKRLLAQANGLSGAEVLVAQVTHLEQQRQLLEEPDPVTPLVASLTQLLRDELNRLHTDYQTRHKNGMARLDADTNWKQLEPEQRNSLLAAQKLTLTDAPKVQVANTDEVLATVDRCRCRRSPTAWPPSTRALTPCWWPPPS